MDKRLRDNVATIPEHLKEKWVDLAYREISGRTNGIVKHYIELLENIDIDFPRKKYSLRNFIHLESLVELMQELERELNHRLELFSRPRNTG